MSKTETLVCFDEVAEIPADRFALSYQWARRSLAPPPPAPTHATVTNSVTLREPLTLARLNRTLAEIWTDARWGRP